MLCSLLDCKYINCTLLEGFFFQAHVFSRSFQIGGEGTNWYKVETFRDESGLTQNSSDICQRK